MSLKKIEKTLETLENLLRHLYKIEKDNIIIVIIVSFKYGMLENYV